MLRRCIIWGMVAVGCFVWGSDKDAMGSLVLTGVFDGPLTGGEPKVIELYALEDIPDLSQYGLGSANNGGGSDGVELILSGAAVSGEFLYVVDDNADGGEPGLKFRSYFDVAPRLVFDSNEGASNGPSSFNGDDAIELFFDPSGNFAGGATIADTFGLPEMRGTGTAWEYLDGWAYRNHDTQPHGANFEEDDWSFSGINQNDGVLFNVEAEAPFPIGTFSQTVLELAGDLNRDGRVDFGDLSPMATALTDPSAFSALYPSGRLLACDVNGDGQCNFGDLSGFASLLTGVAGSSSQGSCPQLPEPASLASLSVAWLAMGWSRRRSRAPNGKFGWCRLLRPEEPYRQA